MKRLSRRSEASGKKCGLFLCMPSLHSKFWNRKNLSRALQEGNFWIICALGALGTVEENSDSSFLPWHIFHQSLNRNDTLRAPSSEFIWWDTRVLGSLGNSEMCSKPLSHQTVHLSASCLCRGCTPALNSCFQTVPLPGFTEPLHVCGWFIRQAELWTGHVAQGSSQSRSPACTPHTG